jgi:uncharacterized protein
MKIFIDIGHPAHVHYFKNFIWRMQEKGHVFFISARDKEVTFTLLDYYKIPYYKRGKGKKGLLGKLFYVLYADFLLIRKALKFKPDVFISFASPYAAHASLVLGKPHFEFNDTDHSFFESFTFINSISYVITPKVFMKNYGSRHIRFDSFMELCSLHPNRYKSISNSIINTQEISEKNRFVILRFVAWNASHDIGLSGLSTKDKYLLVKELSKYAIVIISSEEKLPTDLEKYSFKVHPALMHDVLNDACLLVSESLTMCAEASFLGTPSICISTAQAGTLNEEVRLGLIELFRSSNGLVDRAIEIVKEETYKEKFKLKSNEIVMAKIDVTSFMIWFVENFPSSFEKMKENPDYQLKFK